MCTEICISHFKEHKQAKKPENTKKAKETKEEKRISPENRSKKKISGRPGEDFSGHPHFQKQEYFLALVKSFLIYFLQYKTR